MFDLHTMYLWEQQLRSSIIVHGKKMKADQRHTNKERQLKSGIHSKPLRKGKFN